MKIIHKNNLPDFSLPLPVFESIHIADAVDKKGEEYDIYIGLKKDFVNQLKELSLDESDIELQNNTGDRKRFGEGYYEGWYKKNRTPFCVIHKRTDALAAIVWFGPSPLNKEIDNWHTAGWRSYPSFRGRGLMRNFTKFAMDIYIKNIPNAKFWLKIKKENIGSLGLATSLGFEVREEASNGVSLVMVKK